MAASVPERVTWAPGRRDDFLRRPTANWPAAKPSNIRFFLNTGWLLVLMRTPAWAFLKMSFSSNKPACGDVHSRVQSHNRGSLWPSTLLFIYILQRLPYLEPYPSHRWICRYRRPARHGSCSCAGWGCCLSWSTLLPWHCQISHCPQWSPNLRRKMPYTLNAGLASK